MTAEAKIRTLAGADATLQTFFGTNPFRWFYLQLLPGYLDGTKGMCAQLRRIDTSFLHAQEALVNLNYPRFQLTIRDKDADLVDRAAAAVVDWLSTIDLASDAQFESPATTPRQFPNFVRNLIPGMDPALKPVIYTMVIDWQSWNTGLI